MEKKKIITYAVICKSRRHWLPDLPFPRDTVQVPWTGTDPALLHQKSLIYLFTVIWHQNTLIVSNQSFHLYQFYCWSFPFSESFILSKIILTSLFHALQWGQRAKVLGSASRLHPLSITLWTNQILPAFKKSCLVSYLQPKCWNNALDLLRC